VYVPPALAQNAAVTSDRRAHPRFPLILAVQYVGADSVLDYTENLSATGLFIRTEREFDVGELVTLVISFPQLIEPVEIKVEIVRMRRSSEGSPGGVAVRVPDDRAEDRAKLEEVARRIGAPRGAAPSVRVLLVEDNALVASMYAASLRRLSGAENVPELGIEVASDGATAFDRLLRQPTIDLVVTDVFMPVLSGITLVEKIRSEPSLVGLPIVVITSGGEKEKQKLAGLGVSVFLRKPVSYQEVAGAIKSLLESRLGANDARPAPSAADPGGADDRGGLTDPGVERKDPVAAIPASRR